MPDPVTIALPERGLRFLPGPFQYSGGVAALPGYRLERYRFPEPLPMAAGWARIDALLAARGLPRTAFCACELRSPAPFDDAGFIAFNRAYAAVLDAWGILADGANPVARSNVCPELDPPAEPGFHAVTLVVPAADAAPSFMIAGSGEAREGPGSYAERMIAPGDVSPTGLAEKADWVLGAMERRMAGFGATWADTTAAQLYCVQDVYPLMAAMIVPRGAARHGLTWHYCRPPVAGLEFEMDCRNIAIEGVL